MTTPSVRIRTTAVAALLTLTGAGCGGGSPTDGNGNGGGGGGGGGTTFEETDQVTVTGSAFDPRNISVAPGTVVTWTWQSPGQTHNVTFSSGDVQSSGDQMGGQFQTAMPQSPGTYGYSCTIHDFTGSVRVE